MKKFINKVENIVEEMLEGIILANPNTLALIKEYNVVYTKQINNNKVMLISGGGAGHEPAHIGYIGKGMLDAAICGPIFTSPSAMQILAAIKKIKSKAGVLLIIKNYTGDILNFKMAIQIAKNENIKVDYVVVNDDISLENSLYTIGKRGIAGTVLIHKIVGAAAQMGKKLSTVKAIAEKAIANLASYGISLDACTVPANGKPGFKLSANEMEVGLGIHGEPGIKREQLKTANECVEMLLVHIINNLKLNNGDQIGLMINGLGGTPLMELNILARQAILKLQADGINIIKTFVGNFMTAIEMPGFSISIIKLDNELKKFLQAEAITNGMVVL